MASPAVDQRFWAPVLAIFDFSLTFEEIVMEILPSAVVIALSPFFYFHYCKQPIYVRTSPLLWSKLAISAILIATEAASLILRTLPTEFHTFTSVPSASVELVAALTIGAIIYMEHRRAIRTSSLLAIYLLVGILIDVTKSRSYFLRPGQAAPGSLAAATGFLRLTLFVLHEKSRRSLLLDENIRQNASQGSTSGYLKRTFFPFLTPMLATGFKTELRPEHPTNLGLDFSSKLMHQKLNKYWDQVKKTKSNYGLIIAFGSLVYFVTYTKFAARASIGLHEQLLNTTMGATLAFLSTTKTGVLLNRYSQDSTIFSKALPGYMMRTVYVLCSLAIFTGIVLSGASYMSASLPVILVAIYCIQHFYLRISRQMRHLDLERKAPLYTFFRESAEGLLYIQSAGWQQNNIELGFRLIDDSQQPFYLMYCIQQWLSLVSGLLTAGVAVVLVSITLFVDDSTSGSQVGLAFLGILAFNRTILFFIDSFTQMETSSGALSRLRQFKEKTPQEHCQSPVAVPAGRPATGHVEFTNVTARYKYLPPTATTPNGKEPRTANTCFRPTAEASVVLQHISLSIEPGKKIGLVGRTGSGKSSIILSILGFLPHTGTIKIDGIDVTAIPPDVLRSRLVTITQNQVQFDASIRTNLLPFTMNDNMDDADEKKKAEIAKKDAELQQILEHLNIWKHLKDKSGLDAMLTDVEYSQGEIQLMCIARAIARQRELGTRVVLVDEATSSIDLLRDDVVRGVMEDNFKDCTVLAIAHRSETIQNVDYSVELSRGRIINVW